MDLVEQEAIVSSASDGHIWTIISLNIRDMFLLPPLYYHRGTHFSLFINNSNNIRTLGRNRHVF